MLHPCLHTLSPYAAKSPPSASQILSNCALKSLKFRSPLLTPSLALSFKPAVAVSNRQQVSPIHPPSNQ
jgi:hypothetical protein